MHAVTSIAITLSALALILGVASVGVKTGKLTAEFARKIVHAGMGVLCLSFPYIFDDALPVKLLAAFAVVTLLTVRLSKLRHSVGSALFSVKRISIGELLFPISVAWLFSLSQEQPILYVISLLLLTLADTAGALAGTRFGKVIYHTSAATKSIAGSLAFFATSLLCIGIPLLMFSEMGLAQISILSLTVALFVTAVEGAAGHGTDNLLIPIGAFLLLDYYSELPDSALVFRSLLLIGLLAVLLCTRKLHTFDGGAVLAAILYGFAAATLGGPHCLFAVIFLFVRHLGAQLNIRRQDAATHSLPVIFAIAFPSVGILSLGAEGFISPSSAQYAFICLQAIIIAMLHAGTKKYLGKASYSLFYTALLATLTSGFTWFLDIQYVTLLVTAILALTFSKVYFLWRKSADTKEPLYWLKLSSLTTVSAACIYLTL